MQSWAPHTEQHDRTASCHPVPCVEPAAAKAVGSVAWAAQLSPASSGHRRRAWSKRLQEPVSARASPSSRVCVLRSVCLNGDSSSDFESNSARSYGRSVQNLTSSWMARPVSREQLAKHHRRIGLAADCSQAFCSVNMKTREKATPDFSSGEPPLRALSAA